MIKKPNNDKYKIQIFRAKTKTITYRIYKNGVIKKSHEN